MAATVVTSPYPAILDLKGQGLTLGSVYIGLPNQDPEVSPQAVYWDAALTQPAAQPLQVSAGYIMRDGTPTVAFTAGDYSIRARDRLGQQIFYRAINVSEEILPLGRTILSANTTLYVRATGSDATGTGTAGNPWATPQRAFDVLQKSYDLAGFVVTVDVGAGLFPAAFMACPIPGATNGPGAILVNGAGIGATTVQGVAGGAALGASGGAAFTVANMTVGGGAGTYCLRAISGGNIGFFNVAFGAASQAQVLADSQGRITIAGSYQIVGSSTAHFFAWGGGVIGYFGGPYVCTLIGTPAFSFAFAEAGDNGFISVRNSVLTFAGAATGPRYAAAGNATIDTMASGDTYFPGNAPGFTLTNGVYN